MGTADYFQIIKRNIWIILGTVIIFTIVALVITLKRPIIYQSSATIQVSRHQTLSQASVPYYQYDNFYVEQTATAMSDNIVGLLASPATVSEIYQKAGYPLPSVSANNLSKTFTTKKKISSSAVVDVSYASADQVQSKKLIESASVIIKNKVESVNKENDAARFDVSTTNPVVIETPRATVLNSIIALVLGLFVSLGYIFLKESGKK